jgi:hypothetical protein
LLARTVRVTGVAAYSRHEHTLCSLFTFFLFFIPKLIGLDKENGINKIKHVVSRQYIFIMQIL